MDELATRDELKVPLNFLEEVPTSTQEEIDQKSLEELMRENAVRTLYDPHEIQLEPDNRANRVMSSKGQRAFDSSFIKDNIACCARAIRDDLYWKEKDLADSMERSDRELIKAFRIIQNNLDFETVALIGLSNILFGLQTGSKGTPPEHTTTRAIGRDIEFECFRKYIEELDPALMDYITRFNVCDPTTRRNKKIAGFISTVDDFYEVNWDWMTDNNQMRLGNFIRESIFKETGCFELLKAMSPNGHNQYAIVLTENGEHALERIMESVESSVGLNYPMICKPRHWNEEGAGGGWLTSQPYPRDILVRNCMGSQISSSAIRAVNALQDVAWEINRFIHNIQLQLIDTNTEIGSFRAFNNTLYKDLDVPLIQDPEDLRYGWDDENLEPEEIRKRNLAYRTQKLWEADKDLSEQKAISPRRVVAMASYLLDLSFEDRKYDRFYLPWFMDNRTRCYPMVDTVNPQGSDYQKALIQFRVGVPKSEEARHDCLVSIATTYGQGIDKKSYQDRAEWAKEMEPMMTSLIEDPLGPVSREFWTKADEPFQFLALIHEYVNVYLKEIWSEHRVSSGRDATCSGIQITGAMLRDTRTCRLVNVLPSPEPQDAYADVAKEAVRLLKNDEWLLANVEKNEKNRKNRHEIWHEEFKKLMAEGKRREDQAPPDYSRRTFEDYRDAVPEYVSYINRSVAKMPTMLIPYGGTFLTIFGHVKDKLIEKKAPIHPADFTIITKALIEGMGVALPAFSAVNAWFQSLAKAALDVPLEDEKDTHTIRWETPNGSVIVQEYHNPTTKSVRTYLGDSTTVRCYNSNADNYDSVNNSKMRTALAANVVHSVDASIIQQTVTGVLDSSEFKESQFPFTAVHDCIYGPSGSIAVLQRAVREAFYESVKDDITVHIAENNLPDEAHRLLLPQLAKGRAKVTRETLLMSDYLFS